MPKPPVKDARRKQLIEATLASIVRYGLAATTISHVTEAAKLSRGIVNFYFTSKAGMMLQTLQHLVEEYHSVLHAAQAACAEMSSHERLRAVLAAHFDPALCSPKRLAAWMAFASHAPAHPEYRKLLAASDGKAIALLHALSGGTAGEAASLYARIQGLWALHLNAPAAYPREDLHPLCLATLPGAIKPARKPALTETHPCPAPPKLKRPASSSPARDITQLDFEDLLSQHS